MRKRLFFLSLAVASLAGIYFSGAGGCSHPQGFLLRVLIAGDAGGGKVTANPSVIDCGTDCEEILKKGSSVTLTAHPASGFAFSGWSGGGCSGTADCTVTLTADTDVTATFAPTAHVTLKVTGSGNGEVTTDQGDLACTSAGGACAANVAVGSSLTFTAAPDAGFLFNRWRGATCPSGRTCTVTVDLDMSLEASFTRLPYKSRRNLDRSNAAQPGFHRNIWMTTTDGADDFPLTNFLNADSDTPTLSPDGNRVAYVSERNLTDFSGGATANPTQNIWVEKGDGSGGDIPVTKTTTAQSVNPQWMPDQTKILYVSNRSLTDISNPAASPASSFNLWIANADGSGGDIPLTSFDNIGVDVSGPFALSADGTKVVFTSKLNFSKNPADPANPCENVWVMGSDGTGLTALTGNTDASIVNTQPEWSPDGARIAWSSLRSLTSDDPAATAAGSYNVWVMGADGSDPLALTDRDAGRIDSFTPLWAPDGSFILFVSEMNLIDVTGPENSSNLWRTDPAGGGLAPLTGTLSTFLGDPFWTPDGSLVVFGSSRDFNDLSNDNDNTHNTENIFTMKPDGSGVFAITKIDAPSANSYPPFGFGS